ncbi:MAG: dihydrofolate reductase [Cytophagales bacterium]|nr:dihydrofolate reductase [Rhizobacter sp.]
MTRPTLSLIAAVARNGTIGKNNDLLFRIPEDMQHFKRSTLGCPVIMGRKTWESLPARARPLPGRINIVVTHNREWRADGAVAVSSLEEALSQLGDAPKAFVIGGVQLFAAALPLLDEMLLTEVDQDFDGDVHFPAWNRDDFVETQREQHHAGEPHHFGYAFVTYQRKH